MIINLISLFVRACVRVYEDACVRARVCEFYFKKK